MKILYETPIGYFLIQQTSDKNFLLIDKELFSSVDAAIEDIGQLRRETLTEKLREFLEKNIKDETLHVTDKSIKSILDGFNGIFCQYQHDVIKDLRCSFLDLVNMPKDEYYSKVLCFAHKMSNAALKDCPEKMDVMVIESINLLEDLDKDINLHVMRLKEWYGFHFPELEEIFPNNLDYVKGVLTIGNRQDVEKVAEKDKFFENEKIEEAVQRAKNSMGTELMQVDVVKVMAEARSVLRMYEYRDELNSYLKARIRKLAPNLVVLVGETVAAKLIAKAGSLLSLSKLPSSTLQIMGAEKSLLNAIKNKQDTPKYGYIYNSPIVSQASAHLKGKIARSLASKASLSAKIDAFTDGSNDEAGTLAKKSLEKRLKYMEEMSRNKKSQTKRAKRQFNPIIKYDDKKDIKDNDKKEDIKGDIKKVKNEE